MASFNTAAFPDSLALGKQDALLIGTIDEIQARAAGWRWCGENGGGGAHRARLTLGRAGRAAYEMPAPGLPACHRSCTFAQYR